MKHWKKFLIAMVFIVAPALMAPTGGYPSRPTFQQATITTAGATSTDLYINQTGAPANNRIFRIRNNGAASLQIGAFNDALSTGTNGIVMTATGAIPTISTLALTGTAITGNTIDMTPQAGTFTATLSTGCTTTPTATITYAMIGNIVTLSSASGALVFSCTANAQNRQTDASIPAAIRPASTRGAGMTYVSDNGGTGQVACISVTSSGTLFWDINNAASPRTCSLSADWTASGATSIGPFSVTYVRN